LFGPSFIRDYHNNPKSQDLVRMIIVNAPTIFPTQIPPIGPQPPVADPVPVAVAVPAAAAAVPAPEVEDGDVLILSDPVDKKAPQQSPMDELYI